MKQKLTLQALIEISLFSALALIFDLLMPYRMPQGGSITLVMLPIFVMAYRHGLKGGLATGALVGTLQLLFGAYIFTPVQFLVDYTFAYGLVGMAGVFAGQVKRAAKDGSKKTLVLYLVLGALLGSLLRYAAHVLSGIVFFAQYAEGPVVAYSLGYNMTYMLPSFLIATIVLVLLFTTAPRFATLATRDVR
ncbi:MAG: energy-coupled thiamine transporter ThiT [Exiguobacterium sp.]|uniref:Energy-coupled thiamine transporter ThiT n=1 Tax=Exiguobacterium alkaliphilum TaxID=1428684 RepID=A0ABT2KWY2_9BACL|nr:MULTISPECIES: energy-coupled thiamine transporter ThiT [Exiguobacterium]MDX5323248.1 energy-coupled thiamine transporter ThiT [Exiguobacterium sp.]KDN57474.1 thiamine biosynthesis protein ThiT [Exiguobacterium sp. AB2]MCT4794939.1 energy-coupled thiamine transporter ThiT [Exiguobacterium alkaliphilum]MDX5425033.1 energy-coupled thiamine transporter ThiT [Exiguobacterium sp.]MDX6772464.1 energy-coupled thiamine transporter ThiT [Exiguobacterium sp.]